MFRREGDTRCEVEDNIGKTVKALWYALPRADEKIHDGGIGKQFSHPGITRRNRLTEGACNNNQDDSLGYCSSYSSKVLFTKELSYKAR